MADLKISQLTALTAVAAEAADVLPVVDTSATTTKKISLSDVTEFVVSAGAFTAALGTPIDETLIDAKGDLIVGSANDTAVRLPVGVTNGHVLTVDSVETAGVKWAAIPTQTPAWDSDQNVLASNIFG